METLKISWLEWGAASLVRPGDSESGDEHLVQFFPSGVLVAAVDGVGHGQEAAAAAKTAISILRAYAHEPVIALVGRCHQSLRATRGVVMSLASISVLDGMLTWTGVGNVEGVVLRPNGGKEQVHATLLLRAGVVGNQLPPLQATVLPVARGDLLVFATDGVRSGFYAGPIRNQPPEKIAQGILARDGKGSDDALVLVARYLGIPE